MYIQVGELQFIIEGDKDDANLGEILAKVKNLSVYFDRLPLKEVVKIFNGKFKPGNLFKLCHIRE